jgi:hypothetical protein
MRVVAIGNAVMQCGHGADPDTSSRKDVQLGGGHAEHIAKARHIDRVFEICRIVDDQVRYI